MRGMKMQIKLIASDMDDTLLNRDNKISERNANAIRSALAKNVIFMIATGRMFCSARPYALDLGLDVPLVTYNGALVKGAKSGEVFYEHKLNYDTALEVLDYCKEHKYYAQVYIGDDILVDKKGKWSDKYSEIIGVPITEIGEAVYEIKEAPYKILVMTETEDFQPAWKAFAKKFAGKIVVTSSRDNFLELMEPGVNKWEAVKAVAESYNIKPEEIMCIGDSNNDLAMIKNAGVGVAVGNAKDSVKEHAKIVTASNNDDGVAMVVEAILTQQVDVPEE
jgi:Cof subfamily protein (haloacid dehalogenase superfamily)